MIATTPAPPTPVPPADPTAVIGRRIVAHIIDWAIIVAVVLGTFAAVASTADVPVGVADAQELCDRFNDTVDNYVCIPADTTVILAEDSDLGVVSLVALITFVVGQMILPALTGFSPGKVLVGLRIVKKDSFAKAGLGANIVRSLLWVVDSAPWCFPLVGLVTGLSTKGHRRVGDMAASTLVVDRKWVGRPLPVAGVNDVAPAVGVTAYGGDAPMSPPVLPGAAAPPPTAAPPSGPPPTMPVAPPAPPTTPPPTGGPPASPPPPTGYAAPPPSAAPPPTPDSIAPPAAPPIAPPAEPPPADEPPPTGEPVTAVPPPADPDATSIFEGFDPPPTDDEPTTGDDPTTVVPTAEPAPPTAEPAPPPAEPAPPAAPPPPAAPAPEAPRPGIDAPQWDAARDTYIQWDPELREWMEWSESQGQWIPISQ